ncbi:MAG: hypothetical protein EBT98_00770 [Opitutaceae bacterium]|nr:hypothetical protein [Opitutaceae bacterium]NBR59263.1 hypothetical protein [Opitutaceae bacterium]
MSHNPHANFDQTVIEMIEHSPVGAVPVTPAYQDALKRIYAANRAYANADHKDGHVTARSLAALPLFHAGNLTELLAGQIAPEALEANSRIFDRYVQSLPAARRAKAESYRLTVAGRVAHHRAKHGIAAAHDPVHTLILVPGTGPHPGLPGNYLYGSVFQVGADAASSPWGLYLHDSDDGAARFDAPTMAEVLTKLQEVLESAPFNMNELETLGFRLN